MTLPCVTLAETAGEGTGADAAAATPEPEAAADAAAEAAATTDTTAEAAAAEAAPAADSAGTTAAVDMSQVPQTAADLAEMLRSGMIDVTGNGEGDSNDALACLMYMTGSLPDFETLQTALKDSLLGEQYLDRFSYTGIQQDETSYRSVKISYTLTTVKEKNLVYYVADILVRDLGCFRTQFSHDKYKSSSENVTDTAARNNAIVAINGDYFRARDDGAILRNGVVYRTKAIKKRDVLAMFNDGTMETYEYNEVDMAALVDRGAYQVWDFGPSLLNEDGSSKTNKSDFNTTVFGQNPRTAIGYMEPGHYVFVVVDGRKMNGSLGLDMIGLSELMASLGCKVAYNLDGGGTSKMTSAVYGDISKTSNSERPCSDIIMIVEDYSAFVTTEDNAA